MNNKQETPVFDNDRFLLSEANQDVFVSNNFYQDPDSVRDYALSLDYKADAIYPGFRSPKNIIEDGPIKSLIEQKIGKPILRLETVFQYQTIDFSENSFIHGDLCDWAGVLYLNADNNYKPGTSFYRHKSTQFEKLPFGSELMFSAIERNLQPDDILKPLNEDRLDGSKWDEILNISVQYNRLLLFNAKLYHRNASAWGTDITNSRLVQGFFAYTEPKDGPTLARMNIK